jgi:2Fe-2S ferredoxin
MPKLIIVQANGAQHELEVENGVSVMRAAIENMVDGILGECGGALNCATCHCYVSDAWISRVDQPSVMEKELLEGVVDPDATSRLSCQLVMSDALDGLIVKVPRSQY